jgi:hypothetical protein
LLLLLIHNIWYLRDLFEIIFFLHGCSINMHLYWHFLFKAQSAK